jgi:hypothetical protein
MIRPTAISAVAFLVALFGAGTGLAQAQNPAWNVGAYRAADGRPTAKISSMNLRSEERPRPWRQRFDIAAERPSESSGRLLQSTRDSVRDGALFGLVIGAGYGLFVINKLSRSDDALGAAGNLRILATTAGIGLAIGTLVDLGQ